ncbi:hypothetical protein INP57_19570 [Saccharopolyspora sp. HNM0986]|uniref:hypothetical protein n=1 Tax=Saccharopolyspora galaxeae TaxID=2781241 RepID=UPI00190AE74E|nr:hypothetical protein [Saccharopolyspora sp. HNM0986]MBK0869010.1 hypothetical protein [Saccharopolyspora sp. HNM0986]
MRNIHRGIAAGLLSAPLVLGLGGVATAADYQQYETHAGDEGVSTSQTSSSAQDSGNGRASYERTSAQAGEDGASVSGTASHNGGGQNGGGQNGGEDEGLLSILL